MGFLKKIFSGSNEKEQREFSEGDIFYTKNNKEYNLYKLLVADEEFGCYHVLMYDPVKDLPGDAGLDHLEVYIYHSPIDKKGFPGAELLTNRPVTSDDLIGYHEYLRQTQPPEYYIPIAQNYYQTALTLTDLGNRHEAIDYYSKAIDLVPQFFEAIDNRAFCKMDLGLWAEAIGDFRLSLEQQPGTLLAEFSIGECYFKMGDYQNAKRQFEIAHAINPDHPAPKQFLEKVNEILNK